MKQPPDLFTQEDGSVGTKLIKEKANLFTTASSSYFTFLPLSFWKTVVCESNEYAQAAKNAVITLDEMLKFFGILFYMTIVRKGEYSVYWGKQVDSRILGKTEKVSGLETVMTLKRFQFIRKNLCFRCNISPADTAKDPAARIRPLISMLKYTSSKYVVVGRDVAVDESTIACRSKYGRHLIVYNASKPTGKFHFKIYACCCAKTWLIVSFRLHCRSDLDERLSGVIQPKDAQYLADRLQLSSSVRQIVLEVTQPLHGSKRVVNTDNFYTSVTLLLSLRDVGMYGRGTIREGSQHFPKAHMFAKKAKEPRGSSLQGLSNTGEMVAASWMDGSAVNIISNADSSEMGEVVRKIGREDVRFPAPVCIAEYNKYMQGVDRLDQLRAQFSLADGHSFQKWHKKLALAFIDIARLNAYVTKCLRDQDNKSARNDHRDFMIELAEELTTGSWKDSCEDEGMLFADEVTSTSGSSTTSSPKPASLPPTPTEPPCDFVLSLHQFPEASRGKRGCKVCKFEGRTWTVKTNYCMRHNVCLCTKTYQAIPSLTNVVCPHDDWSCWRKYHEYYLPRGLFNSKGNMRRSSELRHARRQLQLTDDDTSIPVPSPPTLIFSPFNAASASSRWGLEGFAGTPELAASEDHGPHSTTAIVTHSGQPLSSSPVVSDRLSVGPAESPSFTATTPAFSTISSSTDWSMGGMQSPVIRTDPAAAVPLSVYGHSLQSPNIAHI